MWMAHFARAGVMAVAFHYTRLKEDLARLFTRGRIKDLPMRRNDIVVSSTLIRKAQSCAQLQTRGNACRVGDAVICERDRRLRGLEAHSKSRRIAVGRGKFGASCLIEKGVGADG
jgi:hypothetical protein